MSAIGNLPAIAASGSRLAAEGVVSYDGPPVDRLPSYALPLMSLLFAQYDWLDKSVTLLFVAACIVLPTVGYVFMAIDYRAYLRRLRGALVTMVHYFPHLPAWARVDTPPCLRAMGLNIHSTETEVQKAYRRFVEKLHPDRGGDRRQFLILQHHYEEALHLVREHQPADWTTS